MKRLHLSKDKKIAGVCGGIGEYLDVDPTVIRLAWLLVTIITGVFPGAVAYLVAAIVMPGPDEAEKNEPTPKRSSHPREGGDPGSH